MSLRKYTDYNSYLTKLKFDSLGNYLSDRNFRYVETKIISLQNAVNTDYLKKTSNIYISKTPNLKEISLDSMTTIITQPIDLTTNYFSILQLPANNEIQNGTLKNIINTCNIAQTKIIYIYCVNSNNPNLGGFSNLGNIFNCYIFPCNGDNIELCWNYENQTWCVQKYGGYFINYKI
jgi:hypothetical protein